MFNIKNILLVENIRNDILKFNWSRIESIKYDKIKYISKPYTKNDIENAIFHNSFEILQIFMKEIKLNKTDIYLLTKCKQFNIFKYIYDYFINLYDKEDILKIVDIVWIIENDNIEIVEFLINEGIKLEVNCVQSLDMFKLLLKYNFDYNSIRRNRYCAEVIIYMYENELLDYNLSDAIYDGNHQVIDYFLDELDYIPTNDEVCELMNIDYENMYLIKEIDRNDPFIIMNLIESHKWEMIEQFLDLGIDRDELINYCIENKYEDYEELLYNY